MGGRTIGVLCSLALGAGVLGAGVAASGAHPGRETAVAPRAAIAAGKVKSTESAIKYTSKTVIVPRTTVRHDLIGVSASGEFKFKHPSGPLAKLKTGKVMLLQGADALLVTGTSRSKGDLIVKTKPATLTDLISSGKISFSGTPNFNQAVAQKIVAGSSSAPDRAANDFLRPGYPYVGSPPDASGARIAGAPSISAQGTVDPFGYSLTFTPAGDKISVDGVLCFATTSVCGNGPSSGLSLEAHVSGYVTTGKADGGISVSSGRETGFDFTLKGFSVHIEYHYTALRGDGSDVGAHPPVFHVPIGIDYTIPGEIPIYLKLQVSFLVTLGISAKNSVMQGGLELNGGGGSETIDQSGKSVSDSESGDQDFKGTVFDQKNGATNSTLGASGALFDLQFPKMGVGLGYTSVNAMGYVDLLAGISEATGSEIALQNCATYNVAASLGAGLEAQVGLGKFGLSVATPRKVIFPADGKQFTFTTGAPECPM
jgi:hypothetical protein